MARLAWSETPSKGIPKSDAISTLYYDVSDPSTVRYVGTGTDASISQVTSVIRKRFRPMFNANFQGDNGVQKLEIDVLRELEDCVKGYLAVPLV